MKFQRFSIGRTTKLSRVGQSAEAGEDEMIHIHDNKECRISGHPFKYFGKGLFRISSNKNPAFCAGKFVSNFLSRIEAPIISYSGLRKFSITTVKIIAIKAPRITVNISILISVEY